MIVVTGANGQLGRQITERLMALIPPDQIGVSVQDPAKAAGLVKRGVRVRRGNFAEASSLVDAFEGANQVLIVSANKHGDEARLLHRNAISVALDADVGRILYTSHMGACTGSPFAPADQHASTEQELADSGVPFTSLRHGFYAESCLMMVGDALRTGNLSVPEDGPVSWTARADLAEADALILAGRSTINGISPPLTASVAVTMADLASIASEVTGREVRHRVVSDDEWRSARIAAGVPEPYANMLLGIFKAARRGDFATVDPALRHILGREPLNVREVIASALAASPAVQ